MAAFSTTTDGTIEKITLLQAAIRGSLVRRKMNQVKMLYRDIVEDLEGKKSAEELKWSLYSGLAFPVHKQEQSEIELIMKRLREKEASQAPEEDKDKKYSYSSAYFDTESSSSVQSTSGRSHTSGDDTGSVRSKVSLSQESEVSPRDNDTNGNKPAGGLSSNNSINTVRDETVSDHLDEDQTLVTSEVKKVSSADKAAEENGEKEKTVSENTGHNNQEENDYSKETKNFSPGNLSHQEDGKSYALSGRFAMMADKELQENSGDIPQRGEFVKDKGRFEMNRLHKGKEEWTDTRGEVSLEKKDSKEGNKHEDALKNIAGDLKIDHPVSGERIIPSDDQLSEKQHRMDSLKEGDLETSPKKDNVSMGSNERDVKIVDLMRGETAAVDSESKNVARNLVRDFQSAEYLDEKHHEVNVSGKMQTSVGDCDTGIKRDEDGTSVNGDESFIPPSPIHPQGPSKKDNLVSSPLPPPSSTSHSDIPEKVVEDIKGLKDAQSECDAESTVLTKVTNLTSLSMWNDDTSVWNSEDDSPLDAPSLPENLSELQDLRKNIAMELLWVQQAIQSRKAYLRLKEHLGSKGGD